MRSAAATGAEVLHTISWRIAEQPVKFVPDDEVALARPCF
jgi:hypothetical protein